MSFKPLLVGALIASVLLLLLRGSSVNEPKASMSKAEGDVYIVYMEKIEGNAEDLETHHLNTLASVVGSQERAKEAMLYSYKHGMDGFSAKLTAEQVKALSETPGVLQVMPSKMQSLHTAGRGVGGPGPRRTTVGGSTVGGSTVGGSTIGGSRIN